MGGNRDPHDHGSGRTDPRLGDLDHLDKPSSPAPRQDDGLPRIQIDPQYRRNGSGAPVRSKARHSWIVPLIVVLAIGLGAALWFNQTLLRGMLPTTDFNDVLHRAQAALQQGHLDGTDGTSARELFEAARALQPDNDAARDGLNQVGRAEISRADAALQAGDLATADQALTAARELLGGGSDVDRLTQAIAKARVSTGQTATLVAQAQAALDAGRLDGPDGAATLFQRVLSADADNTVAQHGMEQVGAAMAAQVHKALDASDTATASAGIDRLAALLPNYAELPELKAALATLQAQVGSNLVNAIKQGNDALRAGHVSGDGDDNALAYFKAALAIDPNNAEAKAGLGQVGAALIVQANAAIDGGDTAEAHALLDQASALAPKSPDLLAARARLGQTAGSDANTATNGDDTAAGPTTPATLTPPQQAQVSRMLQDAKVAAARGAILSPPGDCAYDLYRGVLAIDGSNATALAGLQGLTGLVQQQFNQALNGGNLPKANDLFDTLSNLSPGDAGLIPARQRLADAWLDQSQHQLESGDRNGAAQSLEQGRKFAPGDQRVQELTTRMQGGG